MVRSPVEEFVKLNAVLPEFNRRAELMVLLPVDCWKMPEDVPVPPMLIVPPVMVVVGPTFARKVRLLAFFVVPEIVMLPVFVVAGEMNRSSLDDEAALKVPEPPMLEVLQKRLLSFQAPTTVEKPAVVPLTSQ
jgi:hypothetical protein